MIVHPHATFYKYLKIWATDYVEVVDYVECSQIFNFLENRQCMLEKISLLK